MNIDNDEWSRHTVASAMADAHKSGHWSCEEIDCHKDGSPINQIMSSFAAQRKALRDEVEKAIGDDLDFPEMAYAHTTDGKLISGDEFKARVATVNSFKVELRTAISIIFEGKEKDDE